MSMRFNTPVFRPQDNKGRTLPGAQLFFYENYSTTPKTTYANVALTNPNPHPIIADGAGKFTDIFLGIGDYRVILTDRKGQILWDRNDVSTNDLTEDVINDIERQLDEVLNQYRMQYLGEYGVADPDLEKTFTVPNAQYVEFNGFAYWTIPGTTLPYTTDSVTYPDPASDPNLTIAPNVTFAYVDTVTNLGDSQLAGGNIWPLSSQDSLPLGAQSSSIPVGVTRLRVNTGSEIEVLYLWEPSGDFGGSAQTVTNITANTTGGYDVVTSIQTYVFTTEVNRVLRLNVRVEGYGAIADGATVADDSFAICHAENGYCKLGTKKEYKLNSLPDETNLNLRGDESVIKFSQTLADRQYDSLDYEGIIFDGEGSNATRCQRIRSDSKVKMRKTTGRNLGPSDFIRFFDISTENVEIDLHDMYNENLEAIPNGTVGDLFGSCRFIYIGDDDLVPSVTTPSRGSISLISGKNLVPFEDGDMIQVQSDVGTGQRFAIEISNIRGENIAKRLVKVQVNGVTVENVNCDARSNPQNMFAIVSHYGSSGSVSNVFGVGKFQNGVDINVQSTTVENVIAINSGVADSQGAAMKVYAGGICNNIYGEGFEHVCAAYLSTGTLPNTEFTKVRGQSTGNMVYGRCNVNAGEFKAYNIRSNSELPIESVKIEEFAGSGFVFKKADIRDVNTDCSTFYAVRVLNTSFTNLADIEGVCDGGASATQTVLVAEGEVRANSVKGSGNDRAVQLNSTFRALIQNAEGATATQVRTSGTNNTVVLNTITTAGIPAVDDNFSNPSTNTQEIGTITWA